MAGEGGSRSFVPPWVQDAVFYQIFPERFANGDPSNDPPETEEWGDRPTTRNFFGGDLAGILARLPYLDSLGVTAIYLNPIFVSSSNHKYNTTDYLRIDPHFGTTEEFRALIAACHGRGIRVILDAVFNHTGVDFFAFADLRARGAASPYTGWFNVHSYPVGPPQRPNYECWWGYGHMPKLMTGNPEVREYLFRVTRHWMEMGIDGWRLDVPNEVPHEFWVEWRRLVKSINPDAYIVGEIWENASRWLGGDQFDGVMNYRFRDACVEFMARGRLSGLSFDTLFARQRADYPAEAGGGLLNLLGSHDTERFLTVCGGNRERLLLAWLFQMSWPGAPMIYYGDEVGMEGGRDPDCRRTMVWETEEQDRGLLEALRSLIAIRRANPVLRQGDVRTIRAGEDDGVYVFARTGAGGAAMVILNAREDDRTVSLPACREVVRSGLMKAVWPAGSAELLRPDTPAAVRVPALTGMLFIGESDS